MGHGMGYGMGHGMGYGMGYRVGYGMGHGMGYRVGYLYVMGSRCSSQVSLTWGFSKMARFNRSCSCT